MNYSLTRLFKLSSAFLAVILLTACPSPAKVKKAIQMSEEIQLHEKFEKLFNQSVNKQKTELLFSSVVKSPGPTIHLNLKHHVTNVGMDEDLP